MLRFKKHPDGPELPEIFQKKTFSSYVKMADFADANNLPPGRYWIRNDKGVNLATAIRELHYRCGYGGFHVEGKGNI